MPDIALDAPFTMEESSLDLDGNTYGDAVARALFTPGGQPQTFNAITGRKKVKYPDDWTLDIELAQDIDTTGSLSQYLHANIGEEVTATLTPVAGGATVSATVVIGPAAIGGGSKQFATSTLSLTCTSTPVITPAA